MKRLLATVVIIGIAGVLLMIGFAAARVFRQINQRHLKTELVFAIVPNDAASVRSLLHEGVNPNTAATYTNGGGFFAIWIHHHLYESTSGGGTRVTDRFTYQAPFGPLGWVAEHIWLNKRLTGMMEYFQEAEKRILEQERC